MGEMDRRGILCCLIAGFLASQAASAAEPARSAKTKQREAVEAILAKPVEWTPADERSITIDAFIAHVREKHGLAIRWDTNSVQLTVAGSEVLGSLSRSSHGAVTNWTPLEASPSVQPYSPVMPPSFPEHVTNFGPPPAAPGGAPVALPQAIPAIDPNATLAVAPEKLAPIAVEGAQPATLPPEAPKPSAASDSTLSSDDEETRPHQILSARPISASAVALTGVSVGEALEQLLDAVAPPIHESGEALGVPISIRALTLDYVIDGRTVVITTRLRANALKETRVYRIANFKGMPPEQLAKTICHSVRPWSWRSQASEIADRMAARFPRGGSLKLPQISVASQYLPSPVVTAAGAGDGSEPEAQTPSPLPSQQPAEISVEELANLGQLLTGGALAAIEATVNTIEIVHYGDPPTGVMEVLPGVLVITQSQGAHREIAELLEELASATTP